MSRMVDYNKWASSTSLNIEGAKSGRMNGSRSIEEISMDV